MDDQNKTKAMLIRELDECRQQVAALKTAVSSQHTDLQETNQQLRTILDSINTAVYVADMETYELLYINQPMRDLFGDVEGQICWQAIQMGQTGPCAFCTNKYLVTAEGKPTGVYAWEFQNTRLNIWSKVHDQAIPWTDGRLVRLEIINDISKRKQMTPALQQEPQQAEKMLQKTNSLFTAVTEQSLDGIGVADTAGNYTLVNDALCNMTGYTKEELLSMNVRDLVPANIELELFPRVATNQSGTRITQLQRKDGSRFYAEVRGSPIQSEGEQLALGIVRDITEHKHTKSELKRLLATERRHNAELKTLHEVSLQITASLKLETILETIVDYTQEIMSANNAHIFLYDGQTVTFGAARWRDKRQRRPFSKIRPYGLTYRVARSGKQIVVPDVESHPIFQDHKWHGAIIGLPLRIGKQVRGVMNVSFKEPHIFKENELRLLGLLADQAAIAIENATLFATERDTREQAEALIKATTVLNRSLDQEQVIHLILEQLARVVTYDSTSIMLVTNGKQELVAHSGFGVKGPLPPVDFATLPHIQETLQQKHPVIIRDIIKDHRWHMAPHGTHIRSWLGVPLIVQNQVIGILNLDKSEPNYYTSRHAELAFAFANQAAIAIENARLYQQAQQDAETKATLLREVNHRVGNNLTAIAGMLSLERRHLQEADKSAYQAIMVDLTNRVTGLSTIHNMLSDSGWQPLHLEDVARRIIQTALQSLPPDQHVAVEINAMPIQVTADLAHNLAILINELATNSVKYAISGRKNAHITVNLLLDQDVVQFEFRDSGPGYPPDVLNCEQYNVGLDLIQQITRRTLHGEVSLYNDNGAVTVIRFKH